MTMLALSIPMRPARSWYRSTPPPPSLVFLYRDCRSASQPPILAIHTVSFLGRPPPPHRHPPEVRHARGVPFEADLPYLLDAGVAVRSLDIVDHLRKQAVEYLALPYVDILRARGAGGVHVVVAACADPAFSRLHPFLASGTLPPPVARARAAVGAAVPDQVEIEDDLVHSLSSLTGISSATRRPSIPIVVFE